MLNQINLVLDVWDSLGMVERAVVTALAGVKFPVTLAVSAVIGTMSRVRRVRSGSPHRSTSPMFPSPIQRLF